KSGALSPTCSAAAGVARPATTSATITSAATMGVRLISESPLGCRASSLHERLDQIDRFLAVPLSRPDRAPDQRALPVDDHRDRNPADAVLASDRHSWIEQRGQAMAVLVHVGLDVLLAAAVEGYEVHEEVVAKALLEGFEALELRGAGRAPRRAEAEDDDFPGERRRADRLAEEIRKGERRRRRALGDEEDRRMLPGGERYDQQQQS